MLQIVLQGLSLGAVSLLMAVGLVLFQRVSGAWNLAAGSLAAFGAYLAVTLSIILQPPLPGWAAWGITLALAALLGPLLALALGTRRMQARFPAGVLLLLALLAAGWDLPLVFWGPLPLSLPGLAEGTLNAGTARLPLHQVLAFVAILALVLAAIVVTLRTRWGLLLRASIERPAAAAPLGAGPLPARLMAALAMVLVVLSALLMAPATFVEPVLGLGLLLRAVAILAIAGTGSLPGIIVMSLFLGMGDVAVASLAGPAWRDVLLVLVILLVPALAPRGLFPPPPWSRPVVA